MRKAPSPRSAAAVQILLPVWGLAYIRQFLRFCIPTLLAPGNIPAITSTIPTKFILLTRSEDVPLIETHPAWQSLANTCTVEIRLIDDLVTRDNHTAVLTLAFHRAISEAGLTACETCFFFLNSDFLIADGSLLNVLRRIQKGASGVLAGNFQIVAEDVFPLLRSKIGTRSKTYTVSARELLSFSFPHFHPTTVANIVNLGLAHNSHTNRLFWRVDENTLLGRFYLAHVIAIKPERTVDHISAPYDYSFIPEMCASERVEVITDSDEYCCVEMQFRNYASDWLRVGPLTPATLGKSLSEWATAQHHGTSLQNVYFHTKGIPQEDKTIEAADRFIEAASCFISPSPAPFRDHPYWQRSIAVHFERHGRPMEKDDWGHFVEESNSKRSQFERAIHSVKTRLFGWPPQVTIIHPLWKDYSIVSQYIGEMHEDELALLVAHRPTSYTNWLAKQPRVRSFELQTLNTLVRSEYLRHANNFDLALLFITSPIVAGARQAVARMIPLLRPGGRLLIMIDGNALADHSAQTLSLLATMDLHLESSFFYESNITKRTLLRMLASLRVIDERESKDRDTPSLWSCIASIPILAVIGLMNLFGPAGRTTGRPGVRYSSAVLVLRRSLDADPTRLPDDLDRQPEKHLIDIAPLGALT